MLFLSDHQTIAFKDQRTIPKATTIEIGVLLKPVIDHAFNCTVWSKKLCSKE